MQTPNNIYSHISNDLRFDMTYILSPRVEQSSHTRNILHLTHYSIKTKSQAWKISLLKPVDYLPGVIGDNVSFIFPFVIGFFFVIEGSSFSVCEGGLLEFLLF
jgi:hypothetical protein